MTTGTGLERVDIGLLAGKDAHVVDSGLDFFLILLARMSDTGAGNPSRGENPCP